MQRREKSVLRELSSLESRVEEMTKSWRRESLHCDESAGVHSNLSLQTIGFVYSLQQLMEYGSLSLLLILSLFLPSANWGTRVQSLGVGADEPFDELMVLPSWIQDSPRMEENF